MSAVAERLLQEVRRISSDVAARHAADVDANARFPHETLAALEEARVLSSAIPVSLGGAGCGIEALAEQCWVLGQACASSAMVLAMHHIQLGSIVRHMGDSPWFVDYLRKCSEQQRLVASVTSEVGPGGDMRQSVCAVEASGETFVLAKHATTMSYGEHADDLLITARRNPEAPPSDQVLVLAEGAHTELSEIGAWDTLGMRGTCSPGGWVKTRGAVGQVLPRPFADIASQTVVPYSHILWGHCWLGIATDAVRKARKFVQMRARKLPGGGAPTSIAHLNVKYQLMRSNLRDLTREYAELERADPEGRLSSVGFALRMNELKVQTSELVVDVVTDALRVVGIMAYKNDGELSMGRGLRDAHSAALMVSNERIAATNASLLLVYKGD